MRVRYTGGIDSVRVPLPNGRVLVADRLEPVDLRELPAFEGAAREADALAKQLLRSEEWEQVGDEPASKGSSDTTKQGGES